MSGSGRPLAGSLRERVTIERRDDALDAGGGAVGDWTEIALVWASVRPIAGGAAEQGGALVGLARGIAWLRPCAVAVGDRIGRVDGYLRVLRVTRDPATPDRIEALVEEMR